MADVLCKRVVAEGIETVGDADREAFLKFPDLNFEIP